MHNDVIDQFLQDKKERDDIQKIMDDLSCCSNSLDCSQDLSQFSPENCAYVKQQSFEEKKNQGKDDRMIVNEDDLIKASLEDYGNYSNEMQYLNTSKKLNQEKKLNGNGIQHNQNGNQPQKNNQINSTQNGFSQNSSENFYLNRSILTSNKTLFPVGFDTFKQKKINIQQEQQQSINQNPYNSNNENNEGSFLDRLKKANSSKDINNFILNNKQQIDKDQCKQEQNQVNIVNKRMNDMINRSISVNSLTQNPSKDSNNINNKNALTNTNQKQFIKTRSKNDDDFLNDLNEDFPSEQILNVERPFIPLEIKSKGGKNGTWSNQYYTVADINEYALKSFSWDQRVNDILTNIYGYKHFRNNQRAIINCVLQNKDVFAMMPTGGGKSLTFQIPALVQDGVYVVVMPLISLIADQYNHMKRLNIPVIKVQGGKKNYQKEIDEILKSDKTTSKIILITPEKISADETIDEFLTQINQQGKLKRFIIDEAHCVSSWGHEFRKDYLSLGQLKKKFPHIPILALTATATEKCKIDIINQLNMKGTMYFQSSFNRTNLYYDVVNVPGKKVIDHMVAYIREKFNKQSGIIYCCARKDAEELAMTLTKQYQINAAYYHGTMNETDKHETQNLWMTNDIQVICATIAFGMGIDKHDVRFVIHYTFSKSIENYYQESGRAGRDGRVSFCRIYYSPKDKSSLQFLISNNEGSNQKKDECMAQLNKMIRYCEDTMSCRRVLQLAHLGEKFEPKFCNKMCDNCRNKQLQNSDIIEVDFTNECKKLLEYLSIISNKIDLTQLQLIDVLRGRKIKKKMSQYYQNYLESSQLYGFLRNYDIAVIEDLIKELMAQGYLEEKIKKIKLFTTVFLDIKKSKVNDLCNSNKQTDPIKIKQKVSAQVAITKQNIDQAYQEFNEPLIDDIDQELPKEQEIFDQNKNLIFEDYDNYSDFQEEEIKELIDFANKNKISSNKNHESLSDMKIQQDNTEFDIEEEYNLNEQQIERLTQELYEQDKEKLSILNTQQYQSGKKYQSDDDEDDEEDEEEYKDLLKIAAKSITEVEKKKLSQTTLSQNSNEKMQKSPSDQDNFFSDFNSSSSKKESEVKSKYTFQDNKTTALKPNGSFNQLKALSNHNKQKPDQANLFAYSFQKLAKN